MALINRCAKMRAPEVTGACCVPMVNLLLWPFLCQKGRLMPVSAPLALIVIAVAGIALATQAPINAALGRSLGSPIGAAAVSFGVGLVVLIGVTLMVSGPQTFAKLGVTPGWQLLGGLLGAFYVSAVLWGVSTLGVLSAMAALILGQMGAALVLDSNGLFGLPVQALSPQRIAAAVLVAAGLVLSRL